MRKVAWLLPSMLEGSGGHRTIIQNASYLTNRNEFTCDIYIEDDGSCRNDNDLKNLVERYFGRTAGCQFYLGFDLKDSYDLIFATAWYTAKIVRDIPGNAEKIYFIQDFEALFNPMGDGYLLACNSYCYGLKPITIGRWLTHKMRTEFNAPSQYFDFCADKSVYKKLPNVQRENAICFVYQPDKPRRCSTIGIEALGIVKYMRPDVKIYLYGSKQKGNVWFDHTNLEIIPIEKCNELYNKCSVGLCISSSNPSRIPFEMMAAGLPVVDLYMENNLYDDPDSGVILAHYTPESIAEAIIKVLDDKNLQEQMEHAGMEYMKDRDLSKGFEQFYTAVKNIVNHTVPDVAVTDQLYKKPPIVADVMKQLPTEIVPQDIYMGASSGIIGKLKQCTWLRKNRLVRKIWRKLKTIFR